MALTQEEKERIRYHLGYLSVQPASSMQFGQPRPVQTLFLVESAMNNLLEVAEGRLRNMLDILDRIECHLVDGLDRLAAKRLDGIELNNKEPDMLEHEYKRWAGRLADLLGVPLYPYSKRFGPEMGAGNVPVVS